MPSQTTISCPNCWKLIPVPMLEMYNQIHVCEACGSPYLVYDPTGPNGELDPQVLLASYVGNPVEQTEFFVLPDFDLVDNTYCEGALGQEADTVRKWSQSCSLYAARKLRELRPGKQWKRGRKERNFAEAREITRRWIINCCESIISFIQRGENVKAQLRLYRLIKLFQFFTRVGFSQKMEDIIADRLELPEDADFGEDLEAEWHEPPDAEEIN